MCLFNATNKVILLDSKKSFLCYNLTFVYTNSNTKLKSLANVIPNIFLFSQFDENCS